jgi:excisionase family DNA binding protein
MKLLYTPLEAAAALSVSRSTIYELMRRGELNSVHIGSCRRIPADALARFVRHLDPQQDAGTAPVPAGG